MRLSKVVNDGALQVGRHAGAGVDLPLIRLFMTTALVMTGSDRPEADIGVCFGNQATRAVNGVSIDAFVAMTLAY